MVARRPARLLLAVVLAVGAGALASCGMDDTQKEQEKLDKELKKAREVERQLDDQVGGTSGATGASGALRMFEAADIERLLDALDDAAGGNAQVLQIVLYPDYAVAEVRDPADPASGVSYVYRDGSLGEFGSPTVAAGADDLGTVAFARSDIAWEAVPGLVTRTPTTIGLPDGEVSHVIVSRADVFAAGDLVIRVYVRQGGRSGYAEYGAGGRLRATHL